jgi:hypothetical protein
MVEKTYESAYRGLAEATVTWTQLRNVVVAIWGEAAFECGNRKVDIFWTDQDGGRTMGVSMDDLQNAFEREEVKDVSFGHVVPLSTDNEIRRGVLNCDSLKSVYFEIVAISRIAVNDAMNCVKRLFPITQSSPFALKPYVAHDRIAQLHKCENQSYDLTRLIRQCEELNTCAAKDCWISVGMLVRSILDHVPPIFSQPNFKAVANNHGGKSLQESMKRLESSLRKIGDRFLHQQIRRKESLPNATQVDFSNDLDVLMEEIIRVTSESKKGT